MNKKDLTNTPLEVNMLTLKLDLLMMQLQLINSMLSREIIVTNTNK